jgi:hypothetical protein
MNWIELDLSNLIQFTIYQMIKYKIREIKFESIQVNSFINLKSKMIGYFGFFED